LLVIVFCAVRAVLQNLRTNIHNTHPVIVIEIAEKYAEALTLR